MAHSVGAHALQAFAPEFEFSETVMGWAQMNMPLTPAVVGASECRQYKSLLVNQLSWNNKLLIQLETVSWGSNVDGDSVLLRSP